LTAPQPGPVEIEKQSIRGAIFVPRYQRRK
jgi:hypothetical protein